ncbi:hypothetical protein ZIOFF_070281 [Zingiber officinale]|uniref:Uncharacterized protein n=1 Tax=Zingiber officinale TaxID=94328 RepID=A0A8J5C7L5_ZINOF|nr:hypothetical protein ZIOFF_070281 [Zingiber officinale]
MSDGVADNVGALVRRLSRLLHRKIADVLVLAVHHKSVGSLGAVAGLAIACIFAWKLLRRSPGRRVGGRRKHRGSPSTSQAVAGDDSLPSEGDLSVGPLKGANAVETVASSVELSLGQIVRKRLGGCRRVWNQNR